MSLIALIGAVVLGQAASGHPVDPGHVPEPPETLDAQLGAIMDRHEIVTAGVGVIRDGALVWTGYYGEQSPGVPAGPDTLFDVASITKTVTAETILRLAARGEIDLDEPMAAYWVDPDIAEDPRRHALTPRLALTHATGFPNWRFFLPDGDLAFVRDPGTGYGYSGEGIEYLARFAAAKLDTPFPDLVEREVFAPLGLAGPMLAVDPDRFGEMVRAVDAEGTFHGHFCRPQSGWCRQAGEYSAADDLRISVPDLSRFLTAVMRADGYGDDLARDRDRVATPTGDQSRIDCDDPAVSECPAQQGYGLGWVVAEYGDRRLVMHGGSDWSEVALVYFYAPSRDGVVILLNAPNARALGAMAEAIEAVDPASPLPAHYRMRADQAR